MARPFLRSMASPASFYGTRSDGMKDFGLFSQQNVGSVTGASVSLNFTSGAIGDALGKPEVFTNELSGSGVDIGGSGLPIGGTPVTAGFELNLLGTEDGAKSLQTGSLGLGADTDISASFTQTVSIADGFRNFVKEAARLVPDITPITPEELLRVDPQ